MEGFENLTSEQRELCENYARAKAKHNGWTNYATWRVHLELLQDYIDGLSKDVEHNGEKLEDIGELSDHLREYTEEYVEMGFPVPVVGEYVEGWANAFVDEVNFDEIARNAVDSYPNLIKPETAETE